MRSGQLNIKSKTVFQRKVNSENLEAFIANRLYVPGWSFRYWYGSPEYCFKNGAYFSVLSIDGKLKGNAILNLNSYVCGDVRIDTTSDSKNYDIIGFMGYFISKPYRKSGLAKKLARNIENSFLKRNSQYKDPSNIAVVVCADAAQAVSKSAFRYIKTIESYDARRNGHIKDFL